MNILNIKNLLRTGILAICILVSCTTGNNSAKENESPSDKEEKHEDVLDLNTKQLQAVGITIGTIEHKNLTAVVKSSGQLAVPPQNEAQVNVLYGGIIRKINVMEGQQVNKGTLLAVLENQDMIKLQQEYLAVKGGFTFVEAEYHRQQLLKAAGAGTGKSQELAEANYNAELAKIKAIEKQLAQMGISAKNVSRGNLVSSIPVKAPISGTIGRIASMTGSFAQPGTSLMDIVDNSKIHADLVVFEKDLSRIKIGQKVNFQLTNQKDQHIEGQIYGINKSFENDSKGVVVHAVIKKPESNLIPGMYVTGLISVGSELVPAVPVEAIVQFEGKKYIYLAEAGKNDTIHFKKFEVTTGIAELGYVQIIPLEQLAENAKMVTKGAFYLQSKATGGSDEH
ncbi:efflux RND transporter periplasmic adaptor subunit [Pedobacter sp.]|jgi:cobalt-zinc-cadmium efflux system membrane fusion protein|uniref:efflux RND transporter periplasmic adaptor subunit n=1 Tax=Pedobacter sp. TaxID=1411316 RepID=UPI002BE69897|nr:efflux RND transporter periplasmic adaptor subunit [Pedobacter sp.]HWW40680.1 efflux RND transporter periplasmic adaptor subunit [Pedobacter sp.]